MLDFEQESASAFFKFQNVSTEKLDSYVPERLTRGALHSCVHPRILVLEVIRPPAQTAGCCLQRLFKLTPIMPPSAPVSNASPAMIVISFENPPSNAVNPIIQTTVVYSAPSRPP